MKDPNVEALNKRTRTDVIITMILSGVFAVYAVIKLFQHAPDAACSSMFLFVIFLLTGLQSYSKLFFWKTKSFI